ncbi:DUF2808 domain-containing protein [Fischerella thermalis CCMEE 5273]|uniref:DUF2808 domain-containing protein n=1 Tax=Chlorogloeopsis fritschii PCC 6912 TaxID=211165 RepID=A0A3S0ZZL5_CHLFR|nr:DUF2808 domain-containing protein [Chlorogloeopsis fritschii]PMB10718.1 DUF2808 domain-containing protein [Fischerella thermalis CCMEE 5273]PMB49446.1 DUF2808 domain-containing protein [Fischerella thermalis CCMEE 5205]RUR83871.1 hypothetical protein PCC6912_21140 [Chlorogloeopsis fritschii PCC 6912]
MKELLVYSATLALASMALLSPSYATANTDDGKVPHIDGNAQFPLTRWRVVRHTIRLHVPKNSKALTELSINVPDTITISSDIKNIKIVDEKGQKINANISVNDRNIQIAFVEPVASNTKFNVELKNVKRQFLGNRYIYQLSAKFVGSDAEIPIGVAQFQLYY